MITLSKSGSTVTFTFDENSGYLQNGTIDVPVNSLSLILDESNMATFRKSASNDIFVSANIAEFGMSKSELEAWYKANMVGSSGGSGSGGTTPEEVQQMIDQSISGKADTTAVTEDISEAVSGKADSSAVTAVNDTLTAHTANTNIHVTSEEKSTWNAKSDFSGSYNDLTDKPTIPTSASQLTNDAGYITSDALSGYAESSAVTAEINAATSGKADSTDVQTLSGTVTAHTADTTIHVTSSDKSTWSGKQDALVSGTNIKTINNESILGSGNITISGGSGGNPTVELTQAEYDALVSAGTVSADTYYIITDATPIDMSNYYTSAQTDSAISAATSGKVDTSSVVTAVTSASTDSQIPTAKAVYDAIPTGGTSFDLPIYSGTGTNALKLNYSGVTASGNFSLAGGRDANGTYTKATGNMSFAFGRGVTASGDYSHAEGGSTNASGNFSHAEGNSTTASGESSHAEGKSSKAGFQSHAEGYNTEAIPLNGSYMYAGENGNAHAEGYQTKAYGYNSHAEGSFTIANNYSEHASGRYNVSSSASTTFGDSGNTLFSVGNGTADNARHNALEIRQNGDIYLTYGGSDIKLQDKLDEIEQVIARALNQINDRLTALENA